MNLIINDDYQKDGRYFTAGLNLICEDKRYFLTEVIKLIESGKPLTIGDKSNPNQIHCKLVEDTFYNGPIPRVVKSNHPRFVVGKRFDYGFMKVSIEDGFTLFYNAKAGEQEV